MAHQHWQARTMKKTGHLISHGTTAADSVILRGDFESMMIDKSVDIESLEFIQTVVHCK